MARTSKLNTKTVSRTAKTIKRAAKNDIAATTNVMNRAWAAYVDAAVKARDTGVEMGKQIVARAKKIENQGRKLVVKRVDAVKALHAKNLKNTVAAAEAAQTKVVSYVEPRLAKALETAGIPTSRQMRELQGAVEHLATQVSKLAAQRRRAA